MDALREKCPWNAEQTMESIRRLTEEEVYELSDAILKGSDAAVCKEIGDLLYHMVFYARIAQEQGSFDIADCLDKVCEKMIFRHPHVFGPDTGKQTSAKEIADTWELVKAREKGGNKTVMEGIPDAMPAMLKALAMQEKARGCGFDWEKREDVWDKVSEELREAQDACSASPEVALQTTAFGLSIPQAEPAGPSPLRGDSFPLWSPRGQLPKGALRGRRRSGEPLPASAAQASQTLIGPKAGESEGTPSVALGGSCEAAGVGHSLRTPTNAKQTEEFGDLLFAVLNAARLYGVDAEAALNATCDKFRRRFNYVESGIRSQGRTLAEATLADMDAFWDEAKSKGM